VLCFPGRCPRANANAPLGRNLRDSDDLSLRKIDEVKFAIYRGSLVAQIISRGIYATGFGLLGLSALANNNYLG